MKFKSISVKHFRNLETAQIDLNPRVNIFIGPNGQGKTNLLEAVYFLSHGKSFRPAKVSTLISNRLKESPFAYVKGVFHNEVHDAVVEARLSDEKRMLSLGGKNATSATLMKNMPLILFSPESLAAIKEGPEIRRDLVDELVVISCHDDAETLANYSRALRTRNKLLKQRLKGEIQEHEFRGVFESLNRSFFKLAAQVTNARISAMNRILEGFQAAVREIMGMDDIEIGFRYLISDEDAMRNSMDLNEKRITQRASELERAELETGLSLVGPHKHDISILFNGLDSRFFSSQGQQRALILSFKIAQIMHHKNTYGSFPVLLLDDVLSELDEKKRFFLVRFLKGIDTQTLVTSTEISYFEERNSGSLSVFEVAGGKFTKKISERERESGEFSV